MSETKKQNPFIRLGKRIVKWFRELRSELKKVVWPTPKQTANNTLVVVAMVLLVSIVIALFSETATRLVSLIISLAR
ncbi:MAG: preprotein translocase subunit SecE [Oscillospiraceae bacterium]|jgi:preprotein translocase subunit SecE|nr:preprotein translocase subunit SecE [Oscillospiraceae bacterium]